MASVISHVQVSASFKVFNACSGLFHAASRDRVESSMRDGIRQGGRAGPIGAAQRPRPQAQFSIKKVNSSQETNIQSSPTQLVNSLFLFVIGRLVRNLLYTFTEP